MRHRQSGRHLGRTAAHRAALYRNLAKALLTFEVIKTTVPKAKELRRFVEPLITLAKVDTVANRRLAFARLRDEAVVAKLFNVIGKLSANRNGGYTRILKAGLRACDRAPVAYIMLTDRPEVDEEVLFYMNSRGLSQTNALSLLLHSYLMPDDEFYKIFENGEMIKEKAASKVENIC